MIPATSTHEHTPTKSQRTDGCSNHTQRGETGANMGGCRRTPPSRTRSHAAAATSGTVYLQTEGYKRSDPEPAVETVHVGDALCVMVHDNSHDAEDKRDDREGVQAGVDVHVRQMREGRPSDHMHGYGCAWVKALTAPKPQSSPNVISTGCQLNTSELLPSKVKPATFDSTTLPVATVLYVVTTEPIHTHTRMKITTGSTYEQQS
ncbi:hypothetical protein ACHHYP_20056 [Achlya hypogyna]|uniref:Uncharacterized protein n=1 Tax=Achlya hypogyna TaxID=1202772 RepID=A0A1V9ZTK7_ACHHY|nr:hypothetical protein ACHHYP_20056 [Achlya hypogyna]